MHLLLTDLLTCPRCGPLSGLILLVDEIVERRILEGWVACPQCRGRWPVRRGFCELRAGDGETPPLSDESAGAFPDQAEAMRIAALLGVTEGPAYILIVGPAAQHAAHLATIVPDIEVIADHAALAALTEESGVSRLASRGGLPFFKGKMRGVWLSGTAASGRIEEGVRVLAYNGRIVLEPAPADADARLAALGCTVLARKDATLVAMCTA